LHQRLAGVIPDSSDLWEERVRFECSQFEQPLEKVLWERLGLAVGASLYDNQNMRGLLILFTAMMALTCGLTYGNILDELPGTWRITETTTVNGQTETTSYQQLISKSKGGVLNIVTKEKIGGKTMTTAKQWLVPGGSWLGLAYNDKGQPARISEGSYTVRGNVVTAEATSEALGGKITESASIRRVTLNKWVQTSVIKQGDITARRRTVCVRIR
jgi:hypothetical protein